MVAIIVDTYTMPGDVVLALYAILAQDPETVFVTWRKHYAFPRSSGASPPQCTTLAFEGVAPTSSSLRIAQVIAAMGTKCPPAPGLGGRRDQVTVVMPPPGMVIVLHVAFPKLEPFVCGDQEVVFLDALAFCRDHAAPVPQTAVPPRVQATATTMNASWVPRPDYQ